MRPAEAQAGEEDVERGPYGKLNEAILRLPCGSPEPDGEVTSIPGA